MKNKGSFVFILLALLSFSCQQKEKPPLGTPTTSILLLTDENSIDDFGNNAALWSGILSFYSDTWENQKKRGTLYDFQAISPDESPEDFLKTAVARNFELIFCASEKIFPALPKICREFPEQKFAIITQQPLETASNLLQLIISYEEAGYLLGQAVALKAAESKEHRNRFAFLGHRKDRASQKLYLGYAQGISAIMPESKMLSFFLEDNPIFSSARIKTWFESGVFSVFATRDAYSKEVLTATSDLRDKQRDVWLCGISLQDSITADAPILTSIEIFPEIPIHLALNSIKAKKFRGEIMKIGLTEGVLDLSRRNAQLTAEIQQKLDKTLSLITKKDIIIYDNFKDAIKNESIAEELSESEK